MPTIFIKPLPKNDLDQVFRVILECNSLQLKESLGFVPTQSDIHRHTFEDPDFEWSLLQGAYLDKNLIGCVLGIRRPWKSGRESTGFIKWIGVRPAFRRQGAGRKLVISCEKILQSRGCEKLCFGSCSPHYLFPGIPKNDHALRSLFRRMGWSEVSQRISLTAKLQASKRKATNEKIYLECPKEFYLDITTKIDKSRLTQFVEKEFSLSWSLETLPAFDSCDSSFCCYLGTKKTKKILGFASVNTSNPNWFGPMGICSKLRGTGLGRIVLGYAMDHARERGFKCLMFPWVNENDPFYQKSIPNMKKQIFLKTEKELKKSS